MAHSIRMRVVLRETVFGSKARVGIYLNYTQ